MANYKVTLKQSAVKELEQLHQQDLSRIITRIGTLSADPRPPGCEKLSGQERYRIRQGNYRILYEIIDTDRIITIVKIGHRRDVYR